MSNKILLLVVVSLFLLSANTTNSQENENFRVGASINPTLYSSEFMGFEGTTPCCEPYGNNFGLGYGIFGEKGLGKIDFLGGIEYRIRLGVNNVNASWSDEYFVSHRINPNTNSFDSLYSNNNYDISATYVSLRNYFIFGLSDDFQIGGFLDISYPILSSFDKSETVARGLPYTFENGEQSRINESGTIDGLSLQPIVGGSARYKVYEGDDIQIWPEAEFGLSLLDMAPDNNISFMDIRVGVSVAFMEGVDEPIAPPPPPAPEPEAPPVAELPKLEKFESTLTVDGKAYSPGDTITIYRNIERTNFRYTVLPRVFFTKDGNVNDLRYDKLAPEAYSIKDQIVQFFGKNNKNIKLKSYYIEGAGFEPEAYLSEIANQLGRNVSISDVIIDTIREDFDYSELIEEYRRVDILLGGKMQPIDIELDLEEQDISGNTYHYQLEIRPDSLSYLFIPTIALNSNEIGMTIKKDYYAEFQLTDELQKYEIRVSDNLNDTVLRYPYFVKSEDRLNEYEFRVYDEETKTNKRQYLLGYNRFDSSELSYLSEKVKNITDKALSEGKNITIIASTDNLGNREYNKALANRRAKEAVKLFDNKYSEQINIRIPEDYLFDNDHPYGRQLNRAILVRIDE